MLSRNSFFHLDLHPYALLILVPLFIFSRPLSVLYPYFYPPLRFSDFFLCFLLCIAILFSSLFIFPFQPCNSYYFSSREMLGSKMQWGAAFFLVLFIASMHFLRLLLQPINHFFQATLMRVTFLLPFIYFLTFYLHSKLTVHHSSDRAHREHHG